MRDQRQCSDCYQPIRECECEPLPEMRERLEQEREQRKRDEEPWPEMDSGGPLSLGARLSRHFSRVVPGIRHNSPRVTNDQSLATLVFFTVALFALPATASPLCESAVSYEYRNTSTPRPKLAVETCHRVAKAARVFGVRESLAVAVASYESDFEPWEVSGASHAALGAMQIKAAYHCPPFLGFRVCSSSSMLIREGVRHLSELLDEFGERDALRCYNKGRRGCRNPKAGREYAETVEMTERGLRRVQWLRGRR